MEELRLTVNGIEVQGKKGDTVLQVCQRNDIYIPILCHMEGLSDQGTCRMCIVEIEGERGLKTACTTLAREGMVVWTDTERLNQLRRSTLERLFSERNHFCMFCELSGDCELQSLAYRAGIDHFGYPFLYPPLALDSSHPYLLLDHNRCVLCRRCIRACADLVGNRTLGVKGRGFSAMVSVDMDQALSQSTCISCGTCVQVCPTGALFDRINAYGGKTKECRRVSTVCGSCALGCGVELFVRSNHIVRIWGDFASEVNRGVLCVRGRYQPLLGRRERIRIPLMRRNGYLEEVGWEEVLEVVATTLRQAREKRGGALGALVSQRSTNETLYLFRRLFQEVLHGEQVGVLSVGSGFSEEEIWRQIPPGLISSNGTADPARRKAVLRAANSYGAEKLGLNEIRWPENLETLYILLGEESGETLSLSELRRIPHIFLQTSYLSPLVEVAQVVLPSRVWPEKEGSFTDFRGELRLLTSALLPPPGVRDDWELLVELAARLEFEKHYTSPTEVLKEMKERSMV
ncbi:bidirectional [NiFe] hydrogenase diaphorase subunit [Candidatus Hakubella thermalkaliphila]|nr:bidirectional [NiFe] hydrogenase diaphorase subunit [Candidatus Hakubella thermalkaliphila]